MACVLAERDVQLAVTSDVNTSPSEVGVREGLVIAGLAVEISVRVSQALSNRRDLRTMSVVKFCSTLAVNPR